MIKANELRLGNWLIDKDGKLFKVTSIDDGSCDGWINGVSEFRILAHLNPIPLTPEILEKCGFFTPNGYNESVKYKRNVMLDLHRGKILLRDNRLIELTTLHQLQNLHFALTGEELIYKP